MISPADKGATLPGRDSASTIFLFNRLPSSKSAPADFENKKSTQDSPTCPDCQKHVYNKKAQLVFSLKVSATPTRLNHFLKALADNLADVVNHNKSALVNLADNVHIHRKFFGRYNAHQH